MPPSIAELSRQGDIFGSAPPQSLKTTAPVLPHAFSDLDILENSSAETKIAPQPVPTVWSNGIQRVTALIMVIAALPLFALLWILVRATSRGPFLYSQLRPGLHGELFRIWKIRSMAVDSDRCPKLARRVAAGDPRVTKIGHLLRKTKLDELPQLWNVVRGEMAFVGPRPIAESLHDELCLHIPGFEARTSVRPGLSNIGQVSIEDNADEGHLHDDWRERFEAELHYIQHRSVSYDLVVIALTMTFLFNKSIPTRIKSRFRQRPLARSA